MYYKEETIDEVLARNDIVDVISGYVSLKKRGRNYEACCPFHHEKTPSFKVDRERQMYHCFGCGVGGTAFTFVMEYENMSFVEAVQHLAERAGMTLPEGDGSRDSGREQYKLRLREINKSAAAYFHYIMKKSPNGKKAYDYFKGRGLTEETIDKFGLGYADIYRDDLYKYLKSKGYTDSELKDSGLVMMDERYGATDRFWGRAMVPILDINGKVIAFGGRVLGDGKPKYINTSDTPVFDKSRNLFAMNLARRSRRKGFICCEGYMDVISMHQAGFDNAVASLGTAFTFGHANILKRYTNEVYLAYDSDGAGVAATLKVIEILREMGMSARVITMAPHKDPDEFIQAEGAEAFEERIENAETDIMFEVRTLSKNYNMNDPKERTNFQNEAAKRLARIEEPLERGNFVDAVANHYMIDRKGLADLVHKIGMSGIVKSEVVAKEERRVIREAGDAKKNTGKDKHAKLLLTWLVNKPKLFDMLTGTIDEECFAEGMYRSVAEKLFAQYRDKGKVEPASVNASFESVEEQRLVAGMLQTDMQIDMTPEEIDGAITDVVRKLKLARIEEQLKTTTDMALFQELIKEKANVAKININIH